MSGPRMQSVRGATGIPALEPAPLGMARLRQARGRKPPWTVYLVWGLWATFFFDPHRVLALFVGGWILQVPLLFFGVLLVMVMVRWPPRSVYPNFLAYVLCLVAMLPFATNRGLARDTLKVIVLEYVLFLGTLLLLKSIRDYITVFQLMIGSYLMWALLGGASGNVRFHPILGNDDGFGPAMLMGACLSYYFGIGASSRTFRRIAFITAGACVVGIVSSFARGAVLATGAVGFVLWLRSPHKGRTAVAVLGGAVVLVIAANVLFPEGKFWAEIKSAFTEGTEEGTGADRWVLWQAAWKVFLARPVFGVGPANFGPFAAGYLLQGDVGGPYINSATLYDRNLHSIYFQILSESGIMGVTTFFLLLLDFWRRNRFLQNVAAGQVWEACGGAGLRLRYISLGLEMALVAFLLTGLFYAQLYFHWVYSILILNACLAIKVRDLMRQPGPVAATRSP